MNGTTPGPGWGAFVEPKGYRTHLRKYVAEKDISTCIVFAALMQKETRNTTGLRVSGVGGCVCARHECMRPNGLGDLQKGERYANMDYIVMSALRGFDLKELAISYDIACQWQKNLRERLARLPPELILDLDNIFLQCGLPIWHASAHNKACANENALNFLIGLAKSDGEGVERLWADLNRAALHTKDMSLGNRADTVEDKVDSHNFLKNLGVVDILRRKLVVAIAERATQVASFKEINKTIKPEVRAEWQKQIDAFVVDHSQPNPYVLSTQDGPSEADIRLELRKEEAKEAASGAAPLHGTSATAFLAAGLQLEDSQRRIRAELAAGTITADREGKTNEHRIAFLAKLRKFRELQRVYTPGAIRAVLVEEAQRDQDLPPVKAEEIRLYLPSQLPEAERLNGCQRGVPEMEARLREAQCTDALVQIRARLYAKGHLITFRNENLTGQVQTTRSQTLIAHVGARVAATQRKYNDAREALLTLRGSDYAPHLKKINNSDLTLDGEERENDAQARDKLARIAVGSHGHPARNAPAKNKVLSWIWTARGALDDNEKELHESLRVEWSRAKARKTRWEEEVMLLREEMRRVVRYLEWQSAWWESQAAVPESRNDISLETQHGMAAYARKQARVYGDLAAFYMRQLSVSARDTVTSVLAHQDDGVDLDGFFAQAERSRRGGGGGCVTALRVVAPDLDRYWIWAVRARSRVLGYILQPRVGFIDDDVPEDGLPDTRPIFEDDSDDDLHEASDEKIQQLVARYEQEAGTYARDAKRERGHRSSGEKVEPDEIVAHIAGVVKAGENATTVRPGDWIRLTVPPNRGALAYVVSPTRVLVATAADPNHDEDQRVLLAMAAADLDADVDKRLYDDLDLAMEKRLLVGLASVDKATPLVNPDHDADKHAIVATALVDPDDADAPSKPPADADVCTTDDADEVTMPPPGKLPPDVCTKISFSQPLMCKQHPMLHPTRDELAPFQRTRLHYLQSARFWGDTGFGLMEGDRVVCPAGKRRGRQGWIGRIIEEFSGGTLRYWVKLTEYFGTIPDTQKTPGETFALLALARHLLDPGPTVRLLDRVWVRYSKTIFLDRIGRVVEISGPTLTIELPENTDVGDLDPGQIKQNVSTGGWRFTIPTFNTVRHFLPGDLIRVVYGDLSGRRGFIVHIHPGGVLEIFDGHERPGQEPVFLVWQSDVEFVILEDNAAFSDYSTYQYTTRSEINPPTHPLAESQPVNLEKIQSRLKVASGRLADYLAEVKGDEVKGDERERANLKRYREDLVAYIEKLTHPLTIKGIQERDREADARARRLMNTGKQYEGREVEVVGKHPDKGTWGTVVGDHDSEARAQRMKAWMSANPDKDVYGRRWWDSRGILVSIRTHTGLMIQDIPVNNLVMRRHDLSQKPVPLTRAYHLPSAPSKSPVLAVPRPREDTGEWMCIPALKGKRVDVVLEGVNSVALETHRIFKTSAKIRALEGKAAYLLLADAIDPKSLDKKKVQVFGFSVPHGIGPMCIKPRRFSDDGTTRIDTFKERVVIVGPDIQGDIVAKGCYAQTRPHTEHTHGGGIVEVELESGSLKLYHYSSLCMARNIHIDTTDNAFPCTTFYHDHTM
ncbi:hypothetical protein B0H11DRAFT_1931229 [Mycena galericulata]|nr:hypothetical protein B0H11DRAFT_1931229 [Mycena galericulata]